MQEWNQDEPRSERVDRPAEDPASGPSPLQPPPFGPADSLAEVEPRPPILSSERGLLGWLIAIAVGGIGGLVSGMQELAALMALSGLFVAAQAADIDRRWRLLYFLLAWVVPATAAISFISMATTLGGSGMPDPYRSLLVNFSAWAAILSVLLWLPQVSNALAQVMFPKDPPSHSLKLTARLVAMGYLLALPAAFAMRETLLQVLEGPESPLTPPALAGSLVGYVALALAGVGYRIRRDGRATIARLGLRGIGVRDLVVAALAVAALVLLTQGADLIQKRWFLTLWEQDNRMSRAMTAGLGVLPSLLLGVSAGVGEEITMRGALQPRLGVLRSALLFAALHVQYTWFGILVIFLLGLVLGWVRARTSTSVAMVSHAAFDIIAVFTT